MFQTNLNGRLYSVFHVLCIMFRSTENGYCGSFTPKFKSNGWLYHDCTPPQVAWKRPFGWRSSIDQENPPSSKAWIKLDVLFFRHFTILSSPCFLHCSHGFGQRLLAVEIGQFQKVSFLTKRCREKHRVTFMWKSPALLLVFLLFHFCPWKRLQKKRITSKLTRVMAFFPAKTIVVLEIFFFINISWWPILLDFPKQIGTKERAAYRTCVQVPRQHRKLLTFPDMFKVGILWWFPSKSTESQNVSEGVFSGEPQDQFPNSCSVPMSGWHKMTWSFPGAPWREPVIWLQFRRFA